MATKFHGWCKGGGSDIMYTLSVCIPERRIAWVPDLFYRRHLPDPNASPYALPRDPTDPAFNLTSDFKQKHLKGMKKKDVKIYQGDLPVQCKHVQEAGSRGCDWECYVLEEGGEGPNYWKCGRRDCQGHVYCDKVVQDAKSNVVCFGKKGKRMVCVDG